MQWTPIYDMMMELMQLEPVTGHARSTGSDSKQRRQLSKWLTEHQLDEIFNETDELKHATLLRSHLAPLMKGDHANIAISVSKWIVKEWGGIQSGTDAVTLWYKKCNQYGRADVHNFVNQMGSERIASWSKVLSFAYPQEYPIYDARIGAALNSVLWQIRAPRYFPRVGTQNGRANRAFAIMHKEPMWRPYSLNYHDYISLVYRIAHMSFKGDLLHAELSLFNASLRVLDNFMDAYEAYRTADAERRRNGGRFLLRFSDLDEIRKAKSEQVADMRSEEQADLPL
jgi:hypothetical protein